MNNTTPEPPSVSAVETRRRASVGERLLRAARLLDLVALERLRTRPGAPPVRPAHTRLFPYIRHEGSRSVDIARQLGVTKQAVSALVSDLVEWGIVEQVPDPADGRARLLRWTDRGRAEIQVGLEALDSVVGELEGRIGEEGLESFGEALVELTELLEGHITTE